MTHTTKYLILAIILVLALAIMTMVYHDSIIVQVP